MIRRSLLKILGAAIGAPLGAFGYEKAQPDLDGWQPGPLHGKQEGKWCYFQVTGVDRTFEMRFRGELAIDYWRYIEAKEPGNDVSSCLSTFAHLAEDSELLLL